MKKCNTPLFETEVKAGFPSPANDYIERALDLNELIIKRPAATFFVRVQGESMRDASIQSGDILAVDRSIEPKEGHIIIARIDSEFTVKKLGKSCLIAENNDYPDIPINKDTDFEVWGVVTYVIHRCTH